MLPPSPPLPTNATFTPATRAFTITFDKPLQAHPALNAGNYRATSGLANFWIGLVAASAGHTITGIMQPGLAGPASGFIQYDPPPFDVIGLNGLPVAQFTMPWV